MAKDSMDGILVRLDEIEKLQAELRHLVPRVTNNPSRHQDLSRDTSASIRFPSLFTFPVISNFTSSSTERNERVQKSSVQLNLNDKLSTGNRSSTANLKSARGFSQRKSSARETNLFKNLLESTGKNIARSHARNSLALTSVANSKASTKGIANQVDKDSQEIIKKELKSRAPKTVNREQTQRERSSIQLSEKNGNNMNSIPSSIQTPIIQIHVAETAKPRDVSCLKRRRSSDRKKISTGTFIERIMKKLNYCFVNDSRVTPYHYPGNRKPKRVQGIKILRLPVAKSSAY